MCGIGGSLSRGRDLEPLMPMILEDQRLRGPDNASLVHFSNAKNVRISLAHNRLAVLDLTREANQPFTDAATGACIVFNGEIYNYRELREELRAAGETFTTASDTEVLLKAFLHWREKTFERLNGMFAFAIYEPSAGRLTLARDRFGVKPLYYLNRLDQFAFASNTTALSQFFSPSVDLHYLARGIIYNLYEDRAGSSPFEEIRSLPPGHYLQVTSENLFLKAFYDYRAEVEAETERLSHLSEAEIKNELDERLRAAVSLRLRADVPVTISLSGGLDSGLLTSYLSEGKRTGLEAFTFGSIDNPYSEAHLAKATADKLGIQLHFVDVGLKDLPAVFEKTLNDQGSPFAHPTVMAQNCVFEDIRRRGFRVALGGQGSDEVFLGYRKFQFFYMQDLIRKHRWSKVPGALLGLSKMLAADAGTFRRILQYVHRYSNRVIEEMPFREMHEGEILDMRISKYRDLQDRQIADVGFASLLTLLRYEDRNSMGHSVESRMPFLDFNVMQFGAAIPPSMRIRKGYGKWILREIAKDRLPREVVFSRSKSAFALDARQWLSEGLGQHIYGRIAMNLSRLKDVFSDSTMETLKNRSSYDDPKHFPLMVTAFWLSSRI